MEADGNSSGKLPEHPQSPVPSFEAMTNDGHLSEPYDFPVPGGEASARQGLELQGVPDVPGWKPEWVLFLKTKGDMYFLRDDRKYVWTYTMPEITDLMHGEFRPETFKLTVNDLIRVWETYIEPAPTRDRKGKSHMHQTGRSGETNMPAGGSNGHSQSGNGYLYGAPNDNAGGIHRAASPNAYATVCNGQSSRHQDYYGTHNCGASSSREGPQARYRAPQQNSRRTNGPLPRLRSLDIWDLGRDYDRDGATSHTGNPMREQESTRATADYSPSRIPAPRNASVATHDGVVHPQPSRAILGRLLSPQSKHSWLRDYE